MRLATPAQITDALQRLEGIRTVTVDLSQSIVRVDGAVPCKSHLA